MFQASNYPAPLADFLGLKGDNLRAESSLWTPLPLALNLPSAPSISDFCYETWCVFFLAPRSVSSVPLHHYRSTAPLSPTLKGMQTHIKRGPLILKISRLCSSYFLPSYLSVSVIRMLVGSLSWQHAHKHMHEHTHLHGCTLWICTQGSPTAVPHSAHLANRGGTERWGLLPLCHLQTSPLRFLMVTLMQVNITTIKSHNVVVLHTFVSSSHDVDVSFGRFYTLL